MTLYLGHRSISQFTSCKEDFVKNYLSNGTNPSSKYNKYMALGDTLHIVLAKHNRQKQQNSNNLSTFEDLLRESWIAFGYNNKDEEKEFYNKALRILKNYSQNPKDKEQKILLVEELLTKKVYEDVVLFGKVDKVFINEHGQLEVLDYKTSSKVNFSINPYTDAQLPLYLSLVKHSLGYYPKLISHYYLSSNTKVQYPVKTEDIARLETYFTSTVNNIKQQYDSFKKSS